MQNLSHPPYTDAPHPGPSHRDVTALYAWLTQSAIALTEDEPDAIANMANVAALLFAHIPDLNWCGFYRWTAQSRSAEELARGAGELAHGAGELVLGPFQGKPACLRIPLGRGVCGAAALSRTSQRVADVHAFPGHIACDPHSASELVVPIVHQDRLIAVLDLDSPRPARFERSDQEGLEQLIAAIAPRLVGY